MRKKIVSILLSILLVFSFMIITVGCSKKPIIELPPIVDPVDPDKPKPPKPPIPEEKVPAPLAWGAVPSKMQMNYYHQGLTGMICYGPNTYRDIEWGNDGLTTNDTMVIPDTLNTDQWVETYKNAGFGRIIFVSKHHDGFRLWRTDDFSVAQSATNVDVLEEFSASCTKYDMDVGLYMSPWDVYEDKGKKLVFDKDGVYGNGSGTQDAYPLDDDYNALFEKHLKEIFDNDKYGNNGDFVELWLDGAKNAAKQQKYDYKEWVKIAKDKNNRGTDDELINFHGGEHLEIAWPGNESGYVDADLWSKLQDFPDDGAVFPEKYDNPEGDRWVVWEADYSIRPGWFYHASEDGYVKSAEEIFSRYMATVGNGGVMLMSLPPDKRGLVNERDVASTQAFKAMLDEVFGEGKNLAAKQGVTIASDFTRGKGYEASKAIDSDYDTYWTMEDDKRAGELIVDLGEEKTFDIVELQEYIPLGQRINSYSVEVLVDGEWYNFNSGSVIGYKRLVHGPVTTSNKIKITIKSDYAVPLINNIGVYKGPAFMEKKGVIPPKGLKFINDKDMGGTVSSTTERTESWYLNRKGIEDRRSYMENDVTMLSMNGYKQVTFTGSKFYIRGAGNTQGYGANMRVTIDGGASIDVNLTNGQSSDPRHPYVGNDIGNVIYTSPDLIHAEHTVKIETTDKSSLNKYILIDSLIYCDNPVGFFEFSEVGKKTVNEGSSVEFTVRRLGDSSNAATVRAVSYPGTAVHGEDFIQKSVDVAFAAGEIEKIITFETVDNFKIEEGQYFTVALEPAAEIPQSYNMSVRVDILNNDIPPLHPKGFKMINDSEMGGTPSTELVERSKSWHLSRPDIEYKRNYEKNDVTMLSQDAYKEVKFTGCKFFVRGAGNTESAYGNNMLVIIDGGEPVTVDCTSGTSSDPRFTYAGNYIGMIMYSSPDLAYGEHTVRIEPKNKTTMDRSILIDAIYYLDTQMFEFEQVGSVSIISGENGSVTVSRIGDVSAATSIKIVSEDGTAKSGVDYKKIDQTLNFAANERSKTVAINNVLGAGKRFKLKLINIDSLLIADSFNMIIDVLIK